MARALSIGDTIANYRIDAIAGRGGMGIVYRAFDVDLNRVVALKVIAPDLAGEPDFRARFRRESQTAASIRHPNVITIYRAGEENGLLFIAMDFIEGHDIRDEIVAQGRLKPQYAAHVTTEVASALDAAHARGLVHRDVKPANVLVAGQGDDARFYLTDFGLTKQIDSSDGVTKSGMLLGTLDYIAPEQVMGDALDARADVYALGCVLFHMLTGRVPYPVNDMEWRLSEPRGAQRGFGRGRAVRGRPGHSAPSARCVGAAGTRAGATADPGPSHEPERHPAHDCCEWWPCGSSHIGRPARRLLESAAARRLRASSPRNRERRTPRARRSRWDGRRLLGRLPPA